MKKSLFSHQTDYFDVIVAVAVKPLHRTSCWNNKKLEHLTWKLAFRHPYFSRDQDQKALFWKTFQKAFSKSCAFSVTIFTSFSWQTVSSKYGYMRTEPKFVHSVGLVKCLPLRMTFIIGILSWCCWMLPGDTLSFLDTDREIFVKSKYFEIISKIPFKGL